MQEQTASPQVLSPVLESSPTKVWTPRVIGVTSFLLGIPGGLLLLTVNRWRMGFKREAHKFAVVGSTALLMYTIAVLLVPGEVPSLVTGGINAIAAYYLYKRAESDILRCEQADAQVATANWFVGVLLGLGGTLFYLIMYIGIAVFVSTLTTLAGVPIPG